MVRGSGEGKRNTTNGFLHGGLGDITAANTRYAKGAAKQTAIEQTADDETAADEGKK